MCFSVGYMQELPSFIGPLSRLGVADRVELFCHPFAPHERLAVTPTHIEHFLRVAASENFARLPNPGFLAPLRLRSSYASIGPTPIFVLHTV